MLLSTITAAAASLPHRQYGLSTKNKTASKMKAEEQKSKRWCCSTSTDCKYAATETHSESEQIMISQSE